MKGDVYIIIKSDNFILYITKKATYMEKYM